MSDPQGERMTLIERVFAEMATDTENVEKQSDLIIESYHGADEAGKKLLDDAFICLCGWSLSRLLQNQDDPDEDEDNDIG